MAESKTILIVDDEPDLIASLTDILKNSSYQVLSASNGKQAYEMLESHYADAGAEPIYIVISDWMMPEMSGIQLLDKIRASMSFASLPFLLMSGAVTKEQLEPILNHGADGIILKPFVSAALIAKLRQTVDSREQKELAKLMNLSK